MMSGPYEFALALRYLRPRRTFVSIITLVCVAGVTLGVAVLIIVISVMTGFDRQFRERLLGFSAHARVQRVDGPMNSWKEVARRIEAGPLVRAAAPYVNAQALVETQPERGGPRTFGAMIRGIDPALESRLHSVSNLVREGEFRLSPGAALVGVELADNFRIVPQQHLALYSTSAITRMRAAERRSRAEGSNGVDEASLADDFRVTGLVDFGLNDLNANIVLTSLGDAQDLGDYGDAVQGLSVMLRDPSPLGTEKAAEAIAAMLGPEFEVKTWLSDNGDFLDALSTERHMMFYLLFFIVLVAAFGIMGALITFVMQKTREIGVLKALGAAPASIAALFFCQSLVVGVVGVALGVGSGLTALAYRNPFLRFMSATLGFNLFPASVYQFRELPAQTVASDVIVICSGSLILCLLAGVLPAIRAAWMRPVEALRHE